MTGRHSVMLRPDSVRRVRPPKMTMPKTLAAEPRSQYATDGELVCGQEEGLAGLPSCNRTLEAVNSWPKPPNGDVAGCEMELCGLE